MTRPPVDGVDDPLERVEEQLGAESLTVVGLVECQSTDQVARDLAVAGAERSTRKVDARDLRRRDRVVGDDGAVAWRCPDGRARDARAVSAERIPVQPAIERLVAGAELRDVVVLSERRAALATDYSLLEVLVLDDGSNDDTAHVAAEVAAGDPRCEVIRDEVNRGKAECLNIGFARARHDLILVTDADAHLHPAAVRHLVERLERSPMVAAVAGGPFVTNRAYLIAALQVLEAAAVIGLIRRTHSLTGRVGVVAGVCGLFRRDAVLAVGGCDDAMATEDIDLTWRLLLDGWHTA